MPKFESFAPQAENLEEAEVETSFKERKSVIEKLTNKFPKLRSLVLAFITTTAAMSAPEFVQSHEPVEGTKMEQKADEQETAEAALEKITDQDFKNIVEKIGKETDSFGSEAPKNSLYGETLDYTELNRGVTLKESKKGTVPESARNVFVNYELASGESTKVSSSGANIFSRTKSSFYIAPAEKGSAVEGGKIEMQGIGSTRSEALQNALENSVNFLGISVDTGTSLDEQAIDSDKPSFESTLTTKTKTGGRHFISEYRIVRGEEVKEGMGKKGEYKVIVEITGGQFVPEK